MAISKRSEIIRASVYIVAGVVAVLIASGIGRAIPAAHAAQPKASPPNNGGTVSGGCQQNGGSENHCTNNNYSKTYVRRSPLYSSKQNIVFTPNQDEESINIDNVGTLRPTVPMGKNEITLALDASAVRYPSQKANGLELGPVVEYQSNAQVTFDLNSNKRHIIYLSGRKFAITLLEVRILKNTDSDFPMEYTFGISELRN
jgi:hypothetical protein